ncbi:hypothetical protein CLV78_102390 [Aliiruegeria haliotis]|uniref:Uncharacterized protein n=1 Tax=Aliiruegeria haliotis TaxID=1280846 RepID=A0A2T0RVY0_9RHOB|nr:antifreeze protein [Aliiruegeria haliotis]PRY25213.1 hypothetical protein CLV78_102390 [Aliiruegeria haliotis]
MTRLAPKATDLSRDLLETGIEATMLAIEANVVFAYRSYRLCGFRPMGRGEIHKMVSEKPSAFAASAMAAGFTAMTGQRPDQVVAAAIHPLRAETNRNVRRLGAGEDVDKS